MEYNKPHLTVPDQLARLGERGVTIPHPARAQRILESVGYYRFSAYAYPFREPLAPQASSETAVQYRSNDFAPGTSFEWIEGLWRFDRELRLLILDAIETVEIALRSRIGYHLGARHRFGHLSVEHLSSDACNAPDRERPSRTLFDSWLIRYANRQSSATSEDFILHYVEKYDAKLPIWVATEIMEFGQLVRLYGFMTDKDKSLVGSDLAKVSGAVMARWMKVANYARNLSAHHARLWNRTLTYKTGRVPSTVPVLMHLNTDPRNRARIYGLCAILAYLTHEIRAEDNWSSRFLSLMDTLPDGLPLPLESTMGFPADWRTLPLWA